MTYDRMPAISSRTFVAVAVVTAFVLGLPSLQAHGANRTQQAFAHDRVIVVYESGLSKGQKADSLRSVGVASVGRVSPRTRNTVVVELEDGQTVAEAVVDISEKPGVAYVEPDFWLEAVASSNDDHFLDGSHWGMYGDASSPSNPYGSGAAEAWADGQTGTRSVYVGVIDEGIKVDHPELVGNVWTNPHESVDGVDNDGNGYVDDVHGWDFHNDDASVYDGTSDDHGTHVAGTIGARGGNRMGVAGVNWNVTLIPAKFLGAGGGWTSDAIEAIDYITDLKLRHGLDIVATNNSWSGPNFSQALMDAIERAGDAGILFVAAAGNDGDDLDSDPVYPAAYACDCIITVANIEPDGGLRYDSNFSRNHVDLGAPGTNIISTVPENDGYAWYSGTSMATPHVAGALALCYSADRSQSASQLRSRLLKSGAPTGSLSSSTVTGDRLDIGALMEQCDPRPAPTSVPKPTPTATPKPTPAPKPTPKPTPAPTPAPTSPPSVEPNYVDDLDAAFQRFASGWRQGWSGYADHHFYVPVQKLERVRYATWKPVLPIEGSYFVQVRIPASHATTRKASYRIKTTTGWVTHTRSQRYHRGGWIGLGAHDLTQTPVIKLTDKTGEPTSSGLKIAFDAIRVIPTAATSARIEALAGKPDAPPKRNPVE